jgi:hypothetical protein
MRKSHSETPASGRTSRVSTGLLLCATRDLGSKALKLPLIDLTSPLCPTWAMGICESHAHVGRHKVYSDG